jgi:nucleoside-diphosphate-sugar epimerase
MIGRRVALALMSAGREVIGYDRRNVPDAAYPCIEGDVLDIHRLYAAVAGGPIDAIIHCGGLSGLMVARDNPHLISQINIQGTVNVLELARVARARRVVLCSTIMVYGDAKGAVLDEAACPSPTTVYGASKLACEALMKAYADEREVDGVALRIAHVYGPGRETQCFVHDSIRAALNGRPVSLPHNASSARQYVHVDDVVAAILLAADHTSLRRRVYNVSAGEKHRLDQMTDIVSERLGGLTASFASLDPPEYQTGLLDIGAARADIGYRPRYDLIGGIEGYAAHLREHEV